MNGNRYEAAQQSVGPYVGARAVNLTGYQYTGPAGLVGVERQVVPALH
jgi:hypothetical protein